MLRVLNDPSFIHEVTGLKKELEAYEQMEDGIVEILDEDFEFLNLGPTQQLNPVPNATSNVSNEVASSRLQ